MKISCTNRHLIQFRPMFNSYRDQPIDWRGRSNDWFIYMCGVLTRNGSIFLLSTEAASRGNL